MTSNWKPLHLSSATHVPSLLIKYDFEQSQYKIYLTDLTHIWTEALDRRQIVKRALNADTSIDPSESVDQLQILLRNIQKSLDGEEGTKLSMNRMEKQLNLHLVTPLPAPLNPLHWPIHLTLAKPEVLTTEFVLPCLSQQFVAKVQIDSLLQQLKDKDHVISKLTDRMQSDGIDFSKVFPGQIGSKVGAKLGIREYAGKLVKGLSNFDEEHWRKALSSLLGPSANLSAIILQIFVLGFETLEVNIGTDQADWLRQLKDEDNQEEKGSAEVVSRNAKSSNYTATTHNQISDGHFQQQVTRRSPSSSRGNEKPTAGITDPFQQQKQQKKGLDRESTTTNESDDDRDGHGKPQKDAVLPQDMYSRESAATLTKSGLSPKLDPTLPQAGRLGIDAPMSRSVAGARNASPEIDSEEIKLSLSGNPNLIEAVPKFKGKLGRIGGKAKPEKRSELKGNLIGERPSILDDKSKASSVDNEGIEEEQVSADIKPAMVSRALDPPKAFLTRRETSQERANNKREQLKRQLENKSNTTVRKKRKF